jgi:hypothetical protein
VKLLVVIVLLEPYAVGLPQKCEIIASLVGVDLGLKGYPRLQTLGSLKAVVATTSREM